MEKFLAQVRHWREIQGATAPDRSPHQIDDELLDACLLLVEGMRRVVDESASGEIPESLANLMNFADIGARVRHAQFRAASAVIARINDDVSRILNKVGPRILKKCFSEYDDFFVMLRDAGHKVRCARASNSPEDRSKLLAWAAENLESLISRHKLLLASESAAVRERRWQTVMLTAAVISALAAIAGVWIAYAG